jgi:hypothetical protein
MNKKMTFSHRPSSIVALCIISESEIVKVMPNYSSNFEKDELRFKLFLYSCGMDIERPFFRQDGLQHRNRLNEVVVCSRWVGEERLDEAWLRSGNASKEAIDKASGSKILEDLYRSRNLTQDAQDSLEARDRYNVVKDEEEQ